MKNALLVNLIFIFLGINCLGLFAYNEQHIPNYPYLSGDSLRACCDFVLDEVSSFEPAKIQKPAIIFVTTRYLGQFFADKHLHIKFPYVLVTHNTDGETPGQFVAYLADPKIIHWFGQNPSIDSHTKFSPLPIGIANQFWSHGKKELFDSAIRRASKITKKYWLYVNFSLFEAPYFDAACAIYQKERADALHKLSGKAFTHISPRKSNEAYLDDVAASYFVASPRGHGLDCHRTWEAFLMGAYPIVKTSPLDSIYEGLPVVIINDWDEITQDFLEVKYAELSAKKWSRKKLYAQYWIDAIRAKVEINPEKKEL